MTVTSSHDIKKCDCDRGGVGLRFCVDIFNVLISEHNKKGNNIAAIK